MRSKKDPVFWDRYSQRVACMIQFKSNLSPPFRLDSLIPTLDRKTIAGRSVGRWVGCSSSVCSVRRLLQHAQNVRRSWQRGRQKLFPSVIVPPGASLIFSWPESCLEEARDEILLAFTTFWPIQSFITLYKSYFIRMYCTAKQETETETTAKQRHREGGRSGVRVALHLKFGKVNNELLCST